MVTWLSNNTECEPHYNVLVGKSKHAFPLEMISRNKYCFPEPVLRDSVDILWKYTDRSV